MRQTIRSTASPAIPLALLALIPLLLGGCAYGPGFQGITPDKNQWYAQDDPETGDVPQPELVPITPDLLMEQQRREIGPQETRLPGESPEEAHYTYRVGISDVLSVIVWNHPELSNPMGQFQNLEQMGRRVRKDGTIFYPFVGVVQVAGLTLAEIQAKLTEGLRPYVEEPQVSVRVAAFRSQKAYVTGEVKKPGTVPITTTPITLLDALNKAGGLIKQTTQKPGDPRSGPLYSADQRLAILTRNGQRYPIDLLALYAQGEGNRILRDGDVLYVPDNSRNKIFVMGEVNQQTSVLMHKGRLSLAEAISQARGFNLQTADTGGVYVIRGTLQEGPEDEPRVVPRIFHLNASHAGALIMASQFSLHPQDVVYVDADGLVRWNRIISQITPTIRAAFQTQLLTRGLVVD